VVKRNLEFATRVCTVAELSITHPLDNDAALNKLKVIPGL
jgi:hypothetical protein